MDPDELEKYIRSVSMQVRRADERQREHEARLRDVEHAVKVIDELKPKVEELHEAWCVQKPGQPPPMVSSMKDIHDFIEEQRAVEVIDREGRRSTTRAILTDLFRTLLVLFTVLIVYWVTGTVIGLAP